MASKPKFISVDCYGTLINFEMGPTAKILFEDRIAGMAKAFIDRGHEPAFDGYGVSRLTDVRQLPALLGL